MKDAPTLKADSEMAPAKETEVCDYYGVVSTASTPIMSTQAQSPSGTGGEPGGVRLRKVARVETVNEPGPSQHEPFESVPGSDQPKFSDEEDYVPLRRENPVKEPPARQETLLQKENQIEEQRLSENVRREDIGDQTGEMRRPGKTAADEIREREAVPRSHRRRE